MANGQLNLGKQSGGVLSVSFPDGVNNTEVVLPESGNIVSIDGSVTNNAIARYDGTTGKLQNSGVIITDENRISKYNGTSTDTVTLNAATLFPSTKSDLMLYRDSTGNAYQFIHVGNLPTDASSAFTRRAGLHMSLSNESNAGESAKSADIFVESTSTFSNAPSLVFGVGNSKNMVLDTSGNVLLTSGTGALGYGAGAGGTVTQLTSKSTAVTLNKPSGRIVMHNAALAAGASVQFVLYNSLITANSVLVVTNLGNTVHKIDSVYTTAGSSYIRVTNTSGSSQSEEVVIQFNVIKGTMS